jgi:NAD(P)H-binding
MTERPLTVLVIGSTGSVGRHVLEEAVRAGHHVRALVRSPDRARGLPAGVEVVVGDVTRPETLPDAVRDVDAVVFTHGSHGSKADMEAVDYGGVRNVLTALGDQPARVALMTLIGITNRSGSYNRSTEGPDWKRRSERLVRASGRPYTIVRPGGSITTPQTSSCRSSSRETLGGPAAPATVRSPDVRSPRSWSRASRPTLRIARPSSRRLNEVRRPATSNPCSLLSTPTSPRRSTASGTKTTCPSRTSQHGSGMTWKQSHSDGDGHQGIREEDR